MQKSTNDGKRLSAKDLITTGIFTAILAILAFVVSLLGFLPIFIPLMVVLIPLVQGIPFILFLTKVKKFGMVTIIGTLSGIITCFTGMGYYVMLTGVLFGFLADLILKSGNYSGKVKNVLGYGVYCMWLVGNYIPIVIARDGYYQNLLEKGMGQEYVDALSVYIPDWSLFVLLAACFVFGILGGLIGIALNRKHFARAGVTG